MDIIVEYRLSPTYSASLGHPVRDGFYQVLIKDIPGIWWCYWDNSSGWSIHASDNLPSFDNISTVRIHVEVLMWRGLEIINIKSFI